MKFSFGGISDGGVAGLMTLSSITTLTGHGAVTGAKMFSTWDEVEIKKANLEYKEVELFEIPPPR